MSDHAAPIEYYHFHWLDYIVFGTMLVFSGLSGIYFGFYRRRKAEAPVADEGGGEYIPEKVNDFGSKSMNEYLLGSRKMKAFPVAMSLIASYISGVTILGTPSEIYNFGTQYWLIIVPIILMGFVVSYVYLPVFASLKISSSYEYLEMRFGKGVRTFISGLFVMDMILFLPVVIYVPALAFNQVTGFNLYAIGLIVCVVCLFYTILGGIKAVVYTDAWQVMVMFLSMVVIIILGTITLGGFEEIFNRAADGGRIIFANTNPSLYERNSLLSVLVGGFTYWTSYNSVNQTMVQRYMSLPNLKTARKSIAIFTVGIALFVSMCCYAGVLVYANYSGCDPLAIGKIAADDQLLPGFVMETMGDWSGIPGLFIAGIFGAALSSLSVVLNSTAGVLLEDILRGTFKFNPSERVAGLFVKSSILFLGCIALGLVFVVEKLGGILSVATSLSAIAAGTSFGLFSLGMLVPWSNNKGAIAGALAGAVMSAWTSFGQQAALASGVVAPHKLDVSTEGCGGGMTNGSVIVTPVLDESGVFPLYRLSYWWINPIGIVSVLVVGTLVSLVTRPRDLKAIDPELISPVLHRFLPEECFVNYGAMKLIDGRRVQGSTSVGVEKTEMQDRIQFLSDSSSSSVPGVVVGQGSGSGEGEVYRNGQKV